MPVHVNQFVPDRSLKITKCSSFFESGRAWTRHDGNLASKSRESWLTEHVAEQLDLAGTGHGAGAPEDVAAGLEETLHGPAPAAAAPGRCCRRRYPGRWARWNRVHPAPLGLSLRRRRRLEKVELQLHNPRARRRGRRHLHGPSNRKRGRKEGTNERRNALA